MGLQVRSLKDIVRNGHEHTKTTEQILILLFKKNLIKTGILPTI